MPTSTPGVSDVHVNGLLNNAIVAYVQNQKNFVGPQEGVVPVEKQTDIILKYTKAAWMRDEFKLRGPGTSPAQSGWDIDKTTTYRCDEYGGEQVVPWEMYGNQDIPIDVDRDALALKTQQALIRWDRLWTANCFGASLGYKDVTGVTAAAGATAGTSCVYWDDDTASNFLKDVEYARGYILSLTGFEPNRLYVGYDVWSAIKNSPIATDRYKHTTAESISTDMIARLIEVEKVIVSKSVYSSSIEGTTTPTYGFIAGKNALLCYVEPKPAILKPSAFYTFAWKNVSKEASNPMGIIVRKGTMERERANWLQLGICIDPKLVCGDLGFFFGGIVS